MKGVGCREQGEGSRVEGTFRFARRGAAILLCCPLSPTCLFILDFQEGLQEGERLSCTAERVLSKRRRERERRRCRGGGHGFRV